LPPPAVARSQSVPVLILAKIRRFQIALDETVVDFDDAIAGRGDVAIEGDDDDRCLKLSASS